ncbi:hypothetical protein [Neorhizobium petrolearium]|uniref:hypothetical protein n=1 Tax=Neorhizobium petrolearium TaxID=515361 RepID=UPI003F17F9FB
MTAELVNRGRKGGWDRPVVAGVSAAALQATLRPSRPTHLSVHRETNRLTDLARIPSLRK